jgi:hypothetical protein
LHYLATNKKKRREYNFATGIDARLIIDQIENGIYTRTQYLCRPHFNTNTIHMKTGHVSRE